MQLLEKLTSMGKAPVIVITATQQGNAEAQARAAGAAGFLTKPVDPAALKQLIEELEASE